MIRRPPRSTRTDTLFPYTTLFRSLAVSVMTQDQLKTQQVHDQNDLQQKIPSLSVASRFGHTGGTYAIRGLSGTNTGTPAVGTYFAEVPTPTNNIGVDTSAGQSLYALARSEDRRVGKACVRTCRYRWSPYN